MKSAPVAGPTHNMWSRRTSPLLSKMISFNAAISASMGHGHVHSFNTAIFVSALEHGWPLEHVVSVSMQPSQRAHPMG
eukprot:11930265-Karenia_brevis.AAC.1